MKGDDEKTNACDSGLPGELASEAWNTEKLMSAYEAKKKLEMIGAMMFSSATQRTENKV